jgi:transposase-like protein
MNLEKKMQCGKCGSGDCVKAGQNHGKQRYKCKVCGRQFTHATDKNAEKRANALYLYAVGLSMNAIARKLEVEPSTVLYWIRNYTLKVYEKPEAEGSFAILPDEIRLILKSVKRKYDNVRHIAAVPV